MDDYFLKALQPKIDATAAMRQPKLFGNKQIAQDMPSLQGEPRQKHGCGHRRTGIVANRGGSSYSEKEAENEGVRDRCILQRTTNKTPLQGARTIPASAGNS